MTTDAAIETQESKPPTILPVTIAYFAAFVALGLVTAAIGPALPTLSQQTGTRLGEIGFLFTSQNFGYMLGSLGIGNILDRSRGNLLLATILLVIAGMLAFIPLAPNLWVLTAILLVLGLANGGLDISANVMLVWVYRNRANPFLNALHFFFGVGAFLAPILVAQTLLISGGIRWAFWLLALYPVPAAIWLMKLPSPASPGSTGKVGDSPQKTRWLLILPITLVFMLYVGAEIGFGGWIYTYAISLNLADAAGAAYLTSLFWGALTIGRLLGIAIATRLRPASMLTLDLIGCLVSLGLIWLLPQFPAIVWIGSFLLGLFMASIFPSLLAFADQQMPITGQITRWFFLGTGLGGMLLPWLLGGLIEQRGPAAMAPALFLSLFLALLVFIGLRSLAGKLASVSGEI